MCDTLALRSERVTWLAKNSDRDPLEAQRVDVVPAVRGDRTPTLRCTWVEIPQLPDRHACILGRPAWMWGAEMGVNECGVAIGNEAIFSRQVRKKGVALLGMDLVRLALERADSAEQALQIIVDLLQQHGQGGPAGYTQRDFRYDNSFLIADHSVVWKLETAGRQWVARRVEHADSISNALTIGTEYERSDEATRQRSKNFRRDFDSWLIPFVGASHQRRASSLAEVSKLNADQASFADLAAILRKHHRAEPGGNRDLCMHAAPSHSPWRFLRPSHTVNAMIVRIDHAGPSVAFTGTASSCVSLFRPVDFQGEWSLCAQDLWERHKVWLDQRKLRGQHRRLFQRDIEAAEREIFAAIEATDLIAAERKAIAWARHLYR